MPAVGRGWRQRIADRDAARQVAETPPVSATPPAANAVKAEWVTYAEAIGIDPTGLTKNELIERCDEWQSN